MGLKVAAPVIWVNITLEFAAGIENSSFVTGTQHHIGLRKEVVKGWKRQK